MKILVFTTLYPNTVQTNHGIFVEKRLLELLKRFDIQARVVAPVPWYPRWLAKRRNLPPYYRVPLQESRNGIEISHPRYPVIPGVSWRFAPMLLHLFSRGCVNQLRREFSFDIIDAHFAFPDGVAASSIAAEQGIPCIVTARGSDINDSPNFFLPKYFIRRATKRIGHYIAVSERLKSRLLKLGVKETRVSVFPNGVDTSVFKPRDFDPPKSPAINGPYLLSVGNLRELKGHHIVIRAFAGNPRLEEFSLIIAGTGEMKHALKNLCAELGVEDRVHLIGEVANQELPSLYSNATLFILASSNEGCPNVVLEALACGTPVVATNVGGVPDLLPPELQPFMIEQREPSAVSESIEACLDAKISGEMIREHATTLNWDATCKNLYNLMSMQITNTSNITS